MISSKDYNALPSVALMTAMGKLAGDIEIMVPVFMSRMLADCSLKSPGEGK
jgi:hypothetical protein